MAVCTKSSASPWILFTDLLNRCFNSDGQYGLGTYYEYEYFASVCMFVMYDQKIISSVFQSVLIEPKLPLVGVHTLGEISVLLIKQHQGHCVKQHQPLFGKITSWTMSYYYLINIRFLLNTVELKIWHFVIFLKSIHFHGDLNIWIMLRTIVICVFIFYFLTFEFAVQRTYETYTNKCPR